MEVHEKSARRRITSIISNSGSNSRLAIRNGSALLVSELFQVFPANATAEGAAGGGRMIIMAHI